MSWPNGLSMPELKCEPYRPEKHFDSWNRYAAEAQDCDRFCSSAYWCVPLSQVFAPGGELVVYHSGDGLGVFHENNVRGGRLCLPPDSMWLLGCPILGPDPHGLGSQIVRRWEIHPDSPSLRQTTVAGLYQNHPLLNRPVWGMHHHWEHTPSTRNVASLEGGMDGFLSRRSKNFRSRLRRTVKKAASQGVVCEYMPERCGEVETGKLMDRVVTVEERSWKGRSGQGIESGNMERFYRAMLPLLARDGRLRGLFLTREGIDLAYLFGASFAGYFRGLQFSYSDRESLGLGNVCQYHMISRLAEQGCRDYDLGMGMAYKTRWAESTIASRTVTFQIQRRR